ncbi:MAG: hypothetical protein ACO25F_00285 [Erythrobacter sp.]
MQMKLIAAAAAAALAIAPPAFAQDAAESAAILAGTGSAQAKAQRSLGGAIRGSINGAAATVRSAVRSDGRTSSQARSRSGVTVAGAAIAADVDPLEKTDAPAYRLGNGATIRVSGRMNPSASTSCVKNCSAQPASSEGDAPQP